MGGIIASLIGMFLGSPLKGIEDSLVQAHKDELAATTTEQTLAAQVQVKSLETQLATYHDTMAIRAQTAGQPEVRFLFFFIGLGFALHLFAINVGSIFAGVLPAGSWLLHVAALPGPIADYEGQIVGFFFGAAVAMNGIQSVAGAIASIKRSR